VIALLDLPAITHNPWHPAYVVSAEGGHKFQAEIAPHLRDQVMAEHPTVNAVRVSFGGVPYAGWVRS
jgi:hypothetical protein